MTCHASRFTKHSNILDSQPMAVQQEWWHFFLKRACCCLQLLADCSQLGKIMCLCMPVCTAWAVPERCTKSTAIDFALNALDCLLKNPSGTMARWLAGAQTWNQIWTLLSDQVDDQLVVKILWLLFLRSRMSFPRKWEKLWISVTQFVQKSSILSFYYFAAYD